MLHLGMFFHDLCVLAIFGNRREDEFVILLATVVQNETDLFSSAHFDSRGLEAHFSAALEHPDLDDARRLVRVAGLAGGEASMILMGGRRKGHCDTRRQDCGACRQQNAEGGEGARIFQHADLALLQCALWLFSGLTALGPPFGWLVGPFRCGVGADEFATSYATVPCGCL